MLRALMQVSGFTAISRVLGFLRDILIARYLGSGLLGDAFFSAFRFPNLFRRIFGEGAFNAAFVPMFGRRLEKDGEEEAMKFASNAFSTLLVVLIALTIVAIPCMKWIMGAVVPGFKAKVEMPISSAAGEASERFSVRVDGMRDVYLTVPEQSVDGLDGAYTLTNLHFVEEKQREFLQFFGTGERGSVASLQEVTAEYTAQEQIRAEKDHREPNPATQHLLPNAAEASGAATEADQSRWVIGGNGQARIRLPKGHDYGWFEGELVRSGVPDSVLPMDANGRAPELQIYRNHPDTFDLTVRLSQITFCYLLFMALVAHLSGTLNTFKIFGAPAAAPILLNLVFLVGLGVFVAGMKSELPAHVLAWCVAVAGLLQFMMLYGACRKNGYHIRVQKPVFDGSIKKLVLLMGPGILAAGIQQINLLVGGVIASFKAGAISWLYYSDRVYQLPLGMIGIALGVVLLPEVTRLVRRDDMQGASDSMMRGMELGLIITLPAAVAMMVIPVPLISVLFQRGEFTAEDARQTGMALQGFALGLPGYVLIKVLQPGYFARENTRAPMIMAGITVAVNIVVSLLLFGPFGHVGIAIATTVSAWVNVVLLSRGLRGLLHPGKAFMGKLLRIIAASAGMGALVWLAYQAVGSWFDEAFIQQCIALALLIGLGICTYAMMILAMKVTSVAELKAGFRRG
ncbi:murein biosynthesis integral membrane protein MurJ [Verrucomicrobiaceae bacterium 5K15]|uniref:Probable lipid II flippase MurJ n=1 Tax=Oceaniferula flava TaxID=2800421 RepID=A0AAE2VCY6_9BACT|nr:murein biosynthesis integral membrane protein MurJ [Oceaniferula flavus]MBK1856170.1 murein biosynthesis integral membrane protein MurJ [Oceaniferula flavus]MBM1137477.1 murein biosynthesis integral membrane protein MurJ [Oceaniferula flavus]